MSDMHPWLMLAIAFSAGIALGLIADAVTWGLHRSRLRSILGGE